MRELFEFYTENQTRSMNMTLANELAKVAIGLVTKAHTHTHPPAFRPQHEVPSPSASTTPPESPPALDDEFVLRPELANRFNPKGATSIYHEFYGLGEFEDVPVKGGLKALDEKFGTKWRSGESGYQKAYSRMQQIVKAVDLEVGKGKEIVDVFQEFDHLFVEKECKGLQHMREALVAFLPPKPRTKSTIGRTSPAAEA
jgi:hypothetical protein